ncbi:hypothetical protein ACFX4N_23960 [Priestia sp. YIM B13551]|uniref:hypothetical protein n=1 Tax=Priestia sp. YIM B13551 TaxID=3366306 RepID=UPI00366CF1F1
MSYELVVIPMDYSKHIKQKRNQTISYSSCVLCDEELELLDEFINVAGIPQARTEYEGLFSICPLCGTAHLELLSQEVEFKGPVLIGWE